MATSDVFAEKFEALSQIKEQAERLEKELAPSNISFDEIIQSSQEFQKDIEPKIKFSRLQECAKELQEGVYQKALTEDDLKRELTTLIHHEFSGMPRDRRSEPQRRMFVNALFTSGPGYQGHPGGWKATRESIRALIEIWFGDGYNELSIDQQERLADQIYALFHIYAPQGTPHSERRGIHDVKALPHRWEDMEAEEAWDYLQEHEQLQIYYINSPTMSSDDIEKLMSENGNIPDYIYPGDDEMSSWGWTDIGYTRTDSIKNTEFVLTLDDGTFIKFGAKPGNESPPLPSPCECSDPGCPVHPGESHCSHTGSQSLYRIDMQDETGTLMCENCAQDAFESGLFSDLSPGEMEQDEEDDWEEHGMEIPHVKASPFLGRKRLTGGSNQKSFRWSLDSWMSGREDHSIIQLLIGGLYKEVQDTLRSYSNYLTSVDGIVAAGKTQNSISEAYREEDVDKAVQAANDLADAFNKEGLAQFDSEVGRFGEEIREDPRWGFLNERHRQAERQLREAVKDFQIEYHSHLEGNSIGYSINIVKDMIKDEDWGILRDYLMELATKTWGSFYQNNQYLTPETFADSWIQEFENSVKSPEDEYHFARVLRKFDDVMKTGFHDKRKFLPPGRRYGGTGRLVNKDIAVYDAILPEEYYGYGGKSIPTLPRVKRGFIAENSKAYYAKAIQKPTAKTVFNMITDQVPFEIITDAAEEAGYPGIDKLRRAMRREEYAFLSPFEEGKQTVHFPIKYQLLGGSGGKRETAPEVEMPIQVGILQGRVGSVTIPTSAQVEEALVHQGFPPDVQVGVVYHPTLHEINSYLGTSDVWDERRLLEIWANDNRYKSMSWINNDTGGAIVRDAEFSLNRKKRKKFTPLDGVHHKNLGRHSWDFVNEFGFYDFNWRRHVGHIELVLNYEAWPSKYSEKLEYLGQEQNPVPMAPKEVIEDWFEERGYSPMRHMTQYHKNSRIRMFFPKDTKSLSSHKKSHFQFNGDLVRGMFKEKAWEELHDYLLETANVLFGDIYHENRSIDAEGYASSWIQSLQGTSIGWQSPEDELEDLIQSAEERQEKLQGGNKSHPLPLRFLAPNVKSGTLQWRRKNLQDDVSSFAQQFGLTVRHYGRSGDIKGAMYISFNKPENDPDFIIPEAAADWFMIRGWEVLKYRDNDEANKDGRIWPFMKGLIDLWIMPKEDMDKEVQDFTKFLSPPQVKMGFPLERLLRASGLFHVTKELKERKDRRGYRYCTDDGKRVKCPPREEASKPKKPKKEPKPKPQKVNHEDVTRKVRQAESQGDVQKFDQLMEEIQQTSSMKRGGLLKSGLDKIAFKLGIKGTSKLKKHGLVIAILENLEQKKKLAPMKELQQRMDRIQLAEEGTGISFTDRLINGVLAYSSITHSERYKEALRDINRNRENAKRTNLSYMKATRANVLNELKSGNISQQHKEAILRNLSEAGYGTLKASEMDNYLEGTLKPENLEVEQEEELRPIPTRERRKKEPKKPLDYMDRLQQPLQGRLKKIAEMEKASGESFLGRAMRGIISDEDFHLDNKQHYEAAIHHIMNGEGTDKDNSVVKNTTSRVLQMLEHDEIDQQLTGRVLEKIDTEDRRGTLSASELVKLAKKIPPDDVGKYLNLDKLKKVQ